MEKAMIAKKVNVKFKNTVSYRRTATSTVNLPKYQVGFKLF